MMPELEKILIELVYVVVIGYSVGTIAGIVWCRKTIFKIVREIKELEQDDS